MKTQIEQLKRKLSEIWNTTTSSEKKDKTHGCPSYEFNLIQELKENFTREEIRVSFSRGFIGNNNRNGSIVKNACIF